MRPSNKKELKHLFIGIYDTTYVCTSVYALRAFVEPWYPQDHFVIKNYSLFTDSAKTIHTDIKEICPDIILISVYIWNYDLVKKLLKLLKRIPCKIILGGPHLDIAIAHNLCKEYPQQLFILLNEGELSLKLLIDHS